MLDLAAGRIDGYVSDIPAVQYYIKDKPIYQVVERIPTGEQYSMMFAKNSPLAEKVNAEITKMKQDGTLAKIHERVVRRQGRAELDDRQGHGDAQALTSNSHRASGTGAGRSAWPRMLRRCPSCPSSTPS